MNILADYHHGELYQSHILAMEQRLGHIIFRPIGHEWYINKFYWTWASNEDTVNQYLGKPSTVNKYIPDGIGMSLEYHSEYKYRMITFEKFMDTKFDILLASIPEHFYTFEKLSEIHPSHPKVIFQMGNNWTDYPRTCKNLLNSTIIKIDDNIHHLDYYPEFQLENILLYNEKSISSFINCNIHHYRELFFELESKLIKWDFKEYGITNRDGIIKEENVVNKMSTAQFIWHGKRGGDGYGFNIHKSLALGKPLLVNYDVYYNQKAGKLLRPNINCIDISNKSSNDIIKEIEIVYNQWHEFSNATIEIFNTYVNFEQEALNIKNFIENLV